MSLLLFCYVMETREVVERVADERLSRTTLKEFIDASFIEVLLSKGIGPSQTQARASITGNTFEICVEIIFERLFPHITIRRNVDLPEAVMTGVGGADFVLYDDTGEIVGVIEAKGSADRLEWPDGTIKEPSRPGLRRSDTMKKAICQAYQVSQGMSDTSFYIITSHLPKSDSSVEQLYDMAVGDIIDFVGLIHQYSSIERLLSDAGLY